MKTLTMEQMIAKALVEELKAQGLVMVGEVRRPVMTVPEAAEYLGRSESSIRDMARTGALPRQVVKKLGGRIIIVRAELDKVPFAMATPPLKAVAPRWNVKQRPCLYPWRYSGCKALMQIAD